MLVASVEARTIVRGGQTAEATISLVPGTRLRLTAVMSADSGFDLVARDGEGRERRLYSYWVQQPDPLDSGTYGPLPAGRYEILATTWKGKKWRGTAELRGEEEVSVKMTADP